MNAVQQCSILVQLFDPPGGVNIAKLKLVDRRFVETEVDTYSDVFWNTAMQIGA
jgi:hypothetical protein